MTPMHPVLSVNGQRGRRSLKLRIAVTGTAVIAVFVVNAYLLDGVVGWLWATIGAAPTEFAPEYSERSFRRVQKEMNAEEVRRVLGTPLSVFFRYSDGKYVELDGLSRRAVYGYGLTIGNLTMEEVRRTIGEPQSEIWSYSRSPTTSAYRVRAVTLERGRVTEITHNVRWE